MSKKINQEIRIYGENACLAIFKNRPQDIIQLFLTKEKLKFLSEVTKYCAQNKKAYHIVKRDEIDQMTKATHHEDVCMLIKKKDEIKLEDLLKQNKEKILLLGLEDVSNPHNIGAIIRSAAHFGVDGILVKNKKMAEAPSAIRTSEGGFEFVPVFQVDDFPKTLKELSKKGFQIITTSSHAEKKLYDCEWTNKSIIFLGEEASGLSNEILNSGTAIKIPGTDHVESLNVSVATAVILSDYFQKKSKVTKGNKK